MPDASFLGEPGPWLREAAVVGRACNIQYSILGGRRPRRSLFEPLQPRLLASPWLEIRAGVLFESGNTFKERASASMARNPVSNRSFISRHNLKRDCGEASLAIPMALIRGFKPLDIPKGELPAQESGSSFALPHIRRTQQRRASRSRRAVHHAGVWLVPITLDGSPLHQSYLALEQLAKSSKAGRWAFADLRQNAIILQGLQTPTARRAAASAPGQRVNPSGDFASRAALLRKSPSRRSPRFSPPAR
jgi:hypothetical protein